jgi:hypothetical protein
MTDFKKRYEKRDEPKARYRVRNWAEYDKALVNRGSVWLWFEEESLAKAWEAEPTGKRGAQPVNTD